MKSDSKYINLEDFSQEEEFKQALGIVIKSKAKKEEEALELKKEEIEEIKKKIEEKAYSEGYQLGFDLAEKEGFDKGLKRGSQEGYQDAKKEALNKYETEYLKKLDILDKALSDTIEPQKKMTKELEQEIVILLLELTRIFIGVELSLNPEAFISILREGLRTLPSFKKEIDIKLSLKTYTLIQESLDKFKEHNEQISITIDESIQEGDSIIIQDKTEVEINKKEAIQQYLNNFIKDNTELFK